MYILWLDNGESYEDRQQEILGIFDTLEMANKAKQDAQETIKQQEIEQKTRYSNPSYFTHINCFGMSLGRRNYEFNIEFIQKNTLRNI